MLRDGLYSAYTWRVRHFREGDPNETTVRFTPDGKPYGFVEQLKEDAPGAALAGAEARERAEASARARWQVDLDRYALVEQGHERRPGGRVDHTFTYERAAPTLKEGRYRLRLVESGDRLTEVTYFVWIPEAFTRRYDNMRSANEAIGLGSVGRHGAALRGRRHRHRALLHAARPLGVVAPRRDVGRRGRARAGARRGQRVAADVDVLRHGAAAHDLHGAADRQPCRDVRRLLGVLCAVVHGGRDADAARVRIAPAILARVGERTGQFHRRAGPHGGGLPARDGVLRLRRAPLSVCHAGARLVGSVRSAAASRRAGDLPAVAVGHRELVPGGILGRMPLPRRADRGRGAHRRSIRATPPVHRDRVCRPGGHIRRGARTVPDAAVIRAPGRARHSVDRVWPPVSVLRSASGNRAALHVRRRVVRASDLHRAGARHLDSQSSW